MKNKYLIISLSVFSLLVACDKEVTPRTVTEFKENPNLLEAAMVHCAQNRSTTKYEVECINAREAINLIARAEDDARKVDLEAQSERKRRALRRTQEAAAEARRRAAEADRQRIEDEYLGQFDSVSIVQESEGRSELPIGAQIVQLPTEIVRAIDQATVDEESAVVGGSDLNAVRDELERRQN